MNSPSPVLAGLQHHVMNLQDALLPGIWPVQDNMNSVWAVLLISSFLWILYRLILVFHKPVRDIEELLGQDIPPKPEIALSSVGTHSVVLYWKLPDNYHTPVKNHIHVNGIPVTENDGSSTTVNVPRLQPGRRYTIRAVSINAAGYSSYSQAIHVQTTPEEGQRAARLLSGNELGQSKRPSTAGRRISAGLGEPEKDAAHPVGSPADGSSDTEDTVAKLQKRLDLLRAEDEDLQSQLEDEVAENDRMRASLTEERDRLKKQHDDKEKAWHESRKHLMDLEKASKAAQRKKSKKESEVQQKKKKRQQMQEEMAAWADKIEVMREETEKLRRDRIGIEDKHASRLAEARKAIEDAQAQGKSLEDDIREWGIKIKALEEEKRLTDEKEEEEEQEADRLEKEIESKYQVRLQDLEVRYQEVFGANVQVNNQLQPLLQLQAREPQRFTPTPISDFAYPAYAQPRSNRGSISRGASLPYQQQNFFGAAPGSLASIQTSSPAYSVPFPASSHLDSLTMNSDRDRLGMTAADFEHLTGGAQMSPSADDLLPSNLLSDDPNSTLRPRVRPSILGGVFRAEPMSQDPQSPISQNSGQHSFFASPSPGSVGIDSSNVLPTTDIDRALDNLNDAAPRKAGGIFNFNSRRSAKGSPALGTLRQGHSQSFPRELNEDAPAHSGHQKQLSNPFINMGNFLHRNNSASEEIVMPSKEPVPRKSRRLFSPGKMDPNDPFYNLDRTSSPRPASTYSYEQPNMRPSSESHLFPFNAADHLRLRGSPIGTDWSSLGGGAYSNDHSRRQSIKHGSTSNLSLGSTPLDFDDGMSAKPARVAPIGAGRPGRMRKQKLNPSAPNFISNVFSRDSSKRTPKTDKGAFEFAQDGNASRGGRRSLDIEPGMQLNLSDGFSPPVSRLSRDGHSVMTTTTDSHESVGGESDVTGGTGGTSTSTPKEGFMSRLTRKSSSTKFWGGGKSEKKGHSHTGSIGGASSSRRKSTEIPVTPSEADEADHGVEYLLGRLHTSSTNGGSGAAGDSSTGTTPIENAKRAGLSWGKMMGKKSKKVDSTAMSETSESREDDE